MISKLVKFNTLSFILCAGGRIYCVNGPQMFGGDKVQVYEFEFASGQLLHTFSPRNQVINPLTPRRTLVAPFTKISILRRDHQKNFL